MQVSDQSVSHLRLHSPQYHLSPKPPHCHRIIPQKWFGFRYQKKLAVDLPMFPHSPRSIYKNFPASFVLSHCVSLLTKVVLAKNVVQLSDSTSRSIATFLFPPLLQNKSLDQSSPYSKKLLITFAQITPVIPRKPT